MTARDYLAAVIVEAYGESADECPCEQDLDVADHILAAGYSKPRTISTVEELDALPDDAVILDDMDGPLVKLNKWWHGSTVNLDSYSIIFPATVLYAPKES